MFSMPLSENAYLETTHEFQIKMSFVCIHIFQHKMFIVYFQIQYIENKLTTETINKKYCHICKFSHTYDSIFSVCSFLIKKAS